MFIVFIYVIVLLNYSVHLSLSVSCQHLVINFVFFSKILPYYKCKTCRLCTTIKIGLVTLLISAAPSLTLIHPSTAPSRPGTSPFIAIHYRRRHFLNLPVQTGMSIVNAATTPCSLCSQSQR